MRNILALLGGWGGIRTHEGLAPLPDFKSGAFDHSATHPRTAEITLTKSLNWRRGGSILAIWAEPPKDAGAVEFSDGDFLLG